MKQNTGTWGGNRFPNSLHNVMTRNGYTTIDRNDIYMKRVGDCSICVTRNMCYHTINYPIRYFITVYRGDILHPGYLSPITCSDIEELEQKLHDIEITETMK